MLPRSRSDTCLLDAFVCSPLLSFPSFPASTSRHRSGDVARMSPTEEESSGKNGSAVGEYELQPRLKMNAHEGLKNLRRDREKKSKSQACFGPTTTDRRPLLDEKDRPQSRRSSPLVFLGFDLGLDVDLDGHISFARKDDWDDEVVDTEHYAQKHVDEQEGLSMDTKDCVLTGEEKVDESIDFEPFCRICTCTESEDSSSKLIRPCRCSGTNSYVHISCLQQWRATSARANDVCPVCSYKYRTSRSFFARLLLSETLIKYLTIILSVTAHITFGMGIEAVDNNYLHLDIAGRMFNLLGVVPWWRTKRSWFDIFTLSQGFDMYVLLCNNTVSTTIDTLVLGSSTVGLIGFLIFIKREVDRLRQVGGPNGNHRVLVFIVWLLSVGNRVLSRLCFFMGAAVACSEVYVVILKSSRRYAQVFGEQIIDYHGSKHDLPDHIAVNYCCSS